ncbi:MAG: hypothetical protein AAF430_06690 [Myxococcota bacterium]
MSFRTLFSSRAATPATDFVILALLVLGSVGLYAQTASFGFVSFDTPRVLLGHPQLYDETSFLSSVQAIFTTFPREEPLVVRDLTWALDARLFGFTNPAGYHAGNVAWNALVVGLLFVFLRRSTGSTLLAGGVTTAFAALPIHVEPVSWVMGRKDLLAATFMLAALLAQHAELGAETPRRRWIAYALGLVFTALALGSKISAIVLWLLLGLHRCFHADLPGVRAQQEEGEGDAAPFARRVKQSAIAVAPHALLSLAVFAWYRGVLHEYGVIGSGGPQPLSAEHLSNVFAFLPWIGWEYAKNLVWPFDLSVYYRWPHVGLPLSPAEIASGTLLGVSVLVGVGAICWKRRDLAFFALWPFVLLAPYTGLFYVGFWRADRYFYLAAAGVLLVAGVFLREAAQRVPQARFAAAAAATLFVSVHATWSWHHQQHWRDNQALWTYEAHRSEPSLFAIQALAKFYTQQAEASDDSALRRAWTRQAAQQVARGLARRDVLALAPTNYRVPEQLQEARLFALQGRIGAVIGMPAAERLAHFRRAFERAPDRSSAILLSQHLYDVSHQVAVEQREPLLRESLGAFVDYVRLSQHDARYLAESERLFEQNFASGRFPFLADEIEAVREVYYP